MKIKVEYDIKASDIESLLCSALEGGSDYWCEVIDSKAVKPKNFKNTKQENIKFHHLSYPMNEGGSIEIIDTETDKEYTLHLNMIKKGLQTMAKKYPNSFSDLMHDEADSATGDVFLQCCLFGETIYG